jgi:hypothetical protein
VFISLSITYRTDVNSGIEMETVCSFRMLANAYHNVWNHKKEDYNVNKLLTRKSVCEVFGKILHHEEIS